MQNHKKSIYTILLLGPMIFFLIFLGLGCDSNDPKVVHPPLRIAINVWPGYAHAFIAAKKGFFTNNGVAVNLQLNKEQSQSVEQYKRGELDGLFDVFTNTVIGMAEGLHAKVVYVADYSQSGDVIIGRSELASMADLKGKTVSFEQVNTFSHIYVLKALTDHDLNESMVRFEIVSPQKVLDALEQGQIDAGHTWEPITSQALAKGYKILSRAGDIPGIITDVLAFKPEVIAQRPQEVQAVVKSMFAAQAFIATNQEEAVAIMAEAVGMSREEMSSGLSGVFQPDLQTNIAAMTQSQSPTSLYNSGKFIVNFLLGRGQLNEELDLSKVIDARFVQALQ